MRKEDSFYDLHSHHHNYLLFNKGHDGPNKLDECNEEWPECCRAQVVSNQPPEALKDGAVEGGLLPVKVPAGHCAGHHKVLTSDHELCQPEKPEQVVQPETRGLKSGFLTRHMVISFTALRKFGRSQFINLNSRSWDWHLSILNRGEGMTFTSCFASVKSLVGKGLYLFTPVK